MATHQKHSARTDVDDPTQRLAVLIDADNAQAAVIDGLLAEIAKFGEATVKRIYGDFTASSGKQWGAALLNKHAIKPVQQFAYSKGKNASDITLIIDAMDLLYTGRFDGFCLVSSDSDFTALAMRIKEQGLTVYGFGEEKTPEAFINTCHKFVFTEILRPIEMQAVARSAGGGKAASAAAKSKQAPHHETTKKLPTDFFREALDKKSEGDWLHLGQFGHYLTKLRPDFDPRVYGYKKLSDLVKARTDLFEIDERGAAGSNAKSVYVRAKRNP